MEPETSIDTAQPIDGPAKKDIENEVSSILASRSEENVKAVALKLVFHNLDYNWAQKEFRQYLKKLSVPFEKVTKVHGKTSGTIIFASIEDKEKAREILSKEVINGKTIQIKEQEDVNKRKLFDIVSKQHAAKRRRTDCQEGSGDAQAPKTVNDIVAPLYNIPYLKQLGRKANGITNILGQIIRECDHTFKIVKKKIGWNFIYYDRSIIPSPVTEHYRNKVSYTIAKSQHPPFKAEVGFLSGTTSDGITTVLTEPDLLSREADEKIKKAFQDFLNKEDTLPPYEKLTHKGFYNEILIRNFLSGETLVCLTVCTEYVEPELVEKEKVKLQEFFHGLTDPKITSFHVVDKNPRISKDAFFQTNTKMAEVLYSKVKDWYPI